MQKTAERIILVDDEKRMCDSLTKLLTGDGYEVDAYQESPAAAEAIRKHKTDLVITDIKMPKLDGIGLLSIVKEVDEEIPVILMTGYAALDSAVEAVARGAYDYLMKPIEFAKLQLAVRRALERRSSILDRRSLLERLKISTMLQERRINELNALYEAGKSIGSTANLQELLRQIVVLASSVTEAKVGSIMLLEENGETMTIEAAIGLEPSVVAKTRLPVGTSIAGHVAKTGEPLMIEDVESHQQFGRINRERYGAASLLCAPLVIKGRVIGVINMANKEDGGVFDENDLKLLTTFAAQAAVAVDDANQFEKNRRRLVEFELLHEVAGELPQIQSLNQFRSILTDKLKRVFPADYGLWFDWDSYNRTLVLGGASGTEKIPLTDSGGIDLARVNRDTVSLTQMDLETMDLSNVAEISSQVAEALAKNDHLPDPKAAFMAVPIIKYGELAHLFCVGAESESPYSVEDISLAKLVISQAALLFEREKSLLNATRLLTMGNMISEISHDLRKPLTSIKGGLQIIKKRWPQVQEAEFMKMVEGEIHRMNELVRELVDFSNPNKYATEKVDLRVVVKRAAELVGPDLKKSKVGFNSHFAKANWEQIVNRNQIMEALLNLFMNAIDAMPEGGTLSVKGMIEQPEHKKTDYLAIKIIDTGIGIRKENLSKVFDRYYTSKETGTGLGLAVVERIISAHNGTLSVASTDGDGSTFTLYFPYQT
ncbi:MAG: GAF domain-containing protein [candidate division Zixibacteria bacterium]|nr:GAF domain-containing protein [candidate division Zixibacteria bacterium]